jgi:hypothetical protein
MQGYDDSRMADMRLLQHRLDNPSLTENERRKIEGAIYAIKNQSQYRSIQKLRDRMTVAVRNGDNRLAEEISREAKRIDRDYGRNS